MLSLSFIRNESLFLPRFFYILFSLMDAATTQLISQKSICSKYDEMLHKMYTDPPENLAKFMAENAELFAYISKHTGAVSGTKICALSKRKMLN